MISGSIGYTSKLTEYIINQAYESAVVQAQIKDPSTDILTGLPFKDGGETIDEAKKAADFKAYINALSDDEKAAAYIRIMSVPSEETVRQTVSETLGSMPREQMEAMLTEALRPRRVWIQIRFRATLSPWAMRKYTIYFLK